MRPFAGSQPPQFRAGQVLKPSGQEKNERKKKRKQIREQKLKDTKPRKDMRAGAKRGKTDSPSRRTKGRVLALGSLDSDAKIVNLGADVCSIRCGQMILSDFSKKSSGISVFNC